MSSISCLCGECTLMLSENRPMMSLYCACKDCTQAIKWGATRGGKAPQQLPQLVYIRSDIISVNGMKWMKAFQLRNPAKSTRVYCTKCYSILGINHPTYSNNVFMFFPNHCEVNLDLSIKPCASLNMSSYEHEQKEKLSNDIPVFHNFDYPQERERFFSIEDVKKTFRKPLIPPSGRTFEDLINGLGEIVNLDLKIGSVPVN